jgi:hypothetical protein
MYYSLHQFSCFDTRYLCWYDCQRALVDDSGVFSCRYHSTVVVHAHISPGGCTIGPLVTVSVMACHHLRCIRGGIETHYIVCSFAKTNWHLSCDTIVLSYIKIRTRDLLLFRRHYVMGKVLLKLQQV